MTTPVLLLGVDGGGTATTAWLADATAAVPLGRGRAGASNVITEGVDAAVGAVREAVAAAFDDAGVAPVRAHAACLALAGAGRASARSAVAAHPGVRGLSERLVVTHDADAVLAGGAGGYGPGLAIVAGTGAVAWGRGAAGETARAGGWGHLVDDAGSAFGIGAAAVRTALRAADGRVADDGLLGLLLQHLGVLRAAELPARLRAPREIAALAPRVVEAAEAGTPSARRIVDGAIGELVAMAATVAERLALPRRGYTLALGGGLLINHDHLARRLATGLTAREVEPSGVVPVPEAARGAAVIAEGLLAGR